MPSDSEVRKAVVAVIKSLKKDYPRKVDLALLGYDITPMVKAALEAAEQERQEGWRPISEAPKDGTTVLLGGCGKPRAGYCDSIGRWTPAYYSGCIIEPTHWMPLPNPPIEDKAND